MWRSTCLLPSTTTGLARVAAKVCPGELILEPTVCPSRTVNTVPAGTTRGFAGSGFIFDIAELEPAASPPGADELLPSLEDGEALESGGAAGLLQPSTANDK